MPSWPRIALYSSVASFCCVLTPLAAYQFVELLGDRITTISSVALALAVVMIIVWLLNAPAAFESGAQGMKKLIPSFGIVVLSSIGLAFYVYLVGEFAAGESRGHHHHHHHPFAHHKKMNGAPAPEPTTDTAR